MTYSNTDYKHIQIDDNCVPIIEGTTMKVAELLTSHLTYGWSPEELYQLSAVSLPIILW